MTTDTDESKFVIWAEAHDDDHAVEVPFDAEEWFKQAKDSDIVALQDCGWGGDYPADEVAIFMAATDEGLKDMFKYIELRHPIKHIGFECHVDEESAMKWVNKHRSHLVRLVIE